VTALWPVALAAGAACGIGIGAALQQRAAHGVPGRGSGGVRLIAVLIHRRSWVLGVLIMVTGYGLQAAALDLGRLAVVEPILATSLVIALLVAALQARSRPRGADWVAMAMATGGVTLFLVAAAPSGGVSQPPAGWWAPLLIGLAALAVASLWRSRSWSTWRAAVALATLAGMTLGTSDALVKTTIAIGSQRQLAVLATFAPYMLVLAGGSGFLLQQHAYRIGELRAALPAASVLEPLTGTVLGLTLFGERLATQDAASALVLVVAALAALAGVWRLGTAPLLAGRAPSPRPHPTVSHPG